MYRTLKTGFSAPQSTLQQLFHIRRICGTIWNDCVQLARYYYRIHGKWINKSDLQAELKGLYSLHSQTIQAVCHKFLRAREGVRQARKTNKSIRYPYKEKFVFHPKWVDKSFVLEGRKLILSLGRWQGKQQTPLVLKLSSVPNGLVKEVELVYDGRWHACLSYEDGINPVSIQDGHTAAIDPGEIHTIAAVSTSGQALVISGRKMRSIHRLRNKKVRELQILMSRCQKGSRKWRQYNRAKKYILSKSERQLGDLLHKTTRAFVNWCVEQKVGHVALGDVEGVQRHTSKRNKKRKRLRSKQMNQKLSNWSFGKLAKQLVYKLEAAGVSLSKENEAYTTQACPACGKRNKVRSRNYQCSCGYERHRDVHGAGNILSQYLHGKFREVMLTDITYLRPVQA
ncbi:RNA-guided endonuclease InsQ/TnpB family protein [Bacillus sp. Hm123]|uniref:RNA-guided endonuclease InsQ/TnpB family protein n=1 Tax=Bacillus sp. Hm123 TaxID=3450745 RepID=UPI003F43A48F